MGERVDCHAEWIERPDANHPLPARGRDNFNEKENMITIERETLTEQMRLHERPLGLPLPGRTRAATVSLTGRDAPVRLYAGDQAPWFCLPNADGDAVSLAELLKDGPVVVTYFLSGSN